MKGKQVFETLFSSTMSHPPRRTSMKTAKGKNSSRTSVSSLTTAEKTQSNNDSEAADKTDNQQTVSNNRASSILGDFSPVASRSKSESVTQNRLGRNTDTPPDESSCHRDNSENSVTVQESQCSQQQLFDSEQTSTITAKEILAAVYANGAAIQTVNISVEKLHASVFEFQLENEKMKKEIEQRKKKEEELYTELQAVKRQAELANERSNQVEQYDRNYNVRIFHVHEPQDETAEQCEETVLKLFHSKLGLRHIQKSDIDAVHRLGQRKENSTRSIIVRFISRKTRNEVLANRRKLKQSYGKSTVIVEDLTKQNYQLYCFARDSSVAQKVWTNKGKTIIKAVNGKIKHIRQKSDLTDPSLRQNTHHTSRSTKLSDKERPSESAATGVRHQNAKESSRKSQLRRDSDTSLRSSIPDSETDSQHESEAEIEENAAETIWT